MLSRPRPITADDDTRGFSCGKVALDNWLQQRALKAEGATARSYVACEGTAVVGYYCLATGSVVRASAPPKLRRNAPEQLPVVIIGRLAVTESRQGQRIGPGLLQDALQRILQVSVSVGCAAALVHAIDDDARSFYAKYGFIEYPGGSRTLFLPVGTLRGSL